MFYSQFKQDQWLDEHVFKGKRDGVFVDVGASDGQRFSNTLFFEESRGWKGVCIEPILRDFEACRSRRKSDVVRCAVALQKGIAEFEVITCVHRGLSGLVSGFSKKHRSRIKKDVKQYEGKRERIQVDTLPLQDILNAHGLVNIDYCSIDVEGAELMALKTIDFDRVTIAALTVENDYHDKRIHELLQAQGYSLVKKLRSDEVFVREGF